MEEQRPGLRQAFVALEHRGFRLFFMASLVSGFGGQLQSISNMWLIFLLTGSALHLGLTGLTRAIPLIFFSLIGGVIADRFDRARIIIFSQAMGGVFALALGLLALTGLVEVWHIYVVTFLGSTVGSLSQPAQRAVIANLVPRHHLMNAMGVNFTVRKFDTIVAPPFGGILIQLVGIPITYGLNGLAHLVTTVALARIDLGPMPARPQGSAVRDLLEGLEYLRARSVILAILFADGAAMLFGTYQVLMPIIADSYGAGPAGYGMLVSAPAVGGLIGATAVMSLGDVRYKGWLIFGGVMAYCCSLVGLALAPWYVLAWVAAAGLGFSDSIQTTPRTALIQLLTPDELRGRVSSFQHLIQGGAPALGHGAMGAAASVVGGPVALVAGAIVCALLNLGIFARSREMRSRDLGSAEPQVEPLPIRV